MKKSQVMAAIALAMALGVVAPIAGVIGGANAITEETATKKGTATTAEVSNAIANAKADALYVAYGNVVDAIDDAKEAYGNDLTVAANITEPAEAEDALDAAWTDVKTAHYVSGVLTGSNLEAKVAYVKNATNYSAWASLYDIKTNPGNYTDATAKSVALTAANTLEVDSTVIDDLEDAANIAAIKTLITNTNFPGYTTMSALVEAVVDAEESNAIVSALYEAANGVSGKVTGINGTTIKAAYEDDAPIQKLAALLLANVQTGADSNYDKVKAKIKDAENALKAAVAPNAETSYTLIDNIAKALTTFTNQTVTPTQLAGSNTGSNNNNDGAGDKEDEDKDTPSADAPAAGILGSANGTATTVSIVAGLATALSALGAGVVAYRSARRSK